MPEQTEFDRSDVESSFQALGVFRTMRSNMAMVMSFVRGSIPKDPNREEYDIGLLGVAAGKAQLVTHSRSVNCFLIALLCQCLDNYEDLKRIKPGLEDADLEAYLDGLEDRERFLSGMTRVRNAVFHVKDMKAWKHPDIVFLARVCEPRRAFPVILETLLNHLYDFTSKCFNGELQIYPRYVYQRAFDDGIPELHARLKAGDISVEEYEKAFKELIEAMVYPDDSGRGETQHLS